MIKKLQALLPPGGLFVLSALVHLAPFLFFGPHPLGYDTGFYRRYLIEPFVSFPNTPVPGLGTDALLPRIFLDALRLLHLSPDVILYGSYVFLFALLPVVIFFFLKPHIGMRGALIAGLFVTLSPVGYAAYWFMLYKNAFALVLIFCALTAIEKGKLWWALALSVSVGLSHKTSAILYLVTLGILFLISRQKRKTAFLSAVAVGVCFLLVDLHAAETAVKFGASAVFMEWGEYLGLSLAFLVALFFGWRGICEKKLPVTLIAFCSAAFLFPVFHLPFYERMFVFSDIALALLAAYAVAYIFSLEKMWRLFVLALIGGVLLGTLWREMHMLTPLVSAQDVSTITNISPDIPSYATLLTTSDEAPWYEGFTNAHIAAPGMLRDTHNLEAWEAFWDATSTEVRIEFLNDFPKPLYISTLGDFAELIGNPIPCLKTVTPQLLLDTCTEP